MTPGRSWSRIRSLLAGDAARPVASEQSSPSPEVAALFRLSAKTASRDTTVSVSAQDIRRRATAAARSIQTHRSHIIVKAVGEDGHVEYAGEYAGPDRYDVTRAVVPEGDMDRWITIGEEVYVSLGIGWFRLGSEPGPSGLTIPPAVFSRAGETFE